MVIAKKCRNWRCFCLSIVERRERVVLFFVVLNDGDISGSHYSLNLSRHGIIGMDMRERERRKKQRVELGSGTELSLVRRLN